MIERYQSPTVQEALDGIVYTSTKFPATQGLGLFARACLVLGDQGMQALVLAGVQSIGDAVDKLQSSLTGRAVVQIAEGLSGDLSLPRELCGLLKASALRPANAVGGPVTDVFDVHFAGEYVHLIRVLLFVLVHNFAGFTLGSRLGSGSPTAAETSTDAQPGSPTPSGGSTPQMSTL